MATLNCTFDVAIGGESAQRIGMKRKLVGLQDESQAKRQSVPTNVTEVDELFQELVQCDAGLNAISSLEIPVTTTRDATSLAAEVDKAKAHIVKLESTESITVLRHGELL